MGRVRWLALGFVALGLGALVGCNNPCQDVCRRMAAYAEDCNLVVPEGEIDACVERQTALEGDDLKACRQFGDPETIRSQWTCQDLALYWGGAEEAP